METIIIVLTIWSFVVGNRPQQPVYYYPQYQQQYYVPQQPQVQYYYQK